MITEATRAFVALKMQSLLEMGVLFLPTTELWAYLELEEKGISSEDICPVLVSLGVVSKDGVCHFHLTDADIKLIDGTVTPPSPELFAS